MNYEKIQAKLDSFKHPLTFDSKHAVPTSIEECIYKVLYARHATFYGNTKRRQCDSGRRRSLGDAYRVTKTYFPEVTYEQIAKLVDKLIDRAALYQHYCDVVKKQVHLAHRIMSKKQFLKLCK